MWHKAAALGLGWLWPCWAAGGSVGRVTECLVTASSHGCTLACCADCYSNFTRLYRASEAPWEFILRANPAALEGVSPCPVLQSEAADVLGLMNYMEVMRLVTIVEIVPPTSDENVTVTEAEFNSVPVRLYVPKRAPGGLRRAMVYIHGGGWCLGDAGELCCIPPCICGNISPVQCCLLCGSCHREGQGTGVAPVKPGEVWAVSWRLVPGGAGRSVCVSILTRPGLSLQACAATTTWYGGSQTSWMLSWCQSSKRCSPSRWQEGLESINLFQLT